MNHSSFLAPHSSFKIDLVYLWVDGSDKKWQAKKDAALLKAGRPRSDFGTRKCRWIDNDELKYSLRSAEKFAPWVNHIYIVADGQRPKWLKSNSRITVVDHKDFIPKEYLPTFSSLAIELFLDRIPGLCEHFIYANDDMFFGCPINPDFFFDAKGDPIVIIREAPQGKALDDAYMNRGNMKHGMYFKRIRRAVRLVYDNFGLLYNVRFKHAVQPMRKSYHTDNFKQFEKLFLDTTATKFREEKNIQRLVFQLLDNAKGRNTLVLNWRPGKCRMVYDVRRDSRARRASHALLWMLATIFGFIRYDLFDKSARWIKFYRPALFCINDTSNLRSNFRAATNIMNEMFPEKSAFEL